MCSAPSVPQPVIQYPPMPDYSAQLNALTMQNQELQDQINEMMAGQTSQVIQDPPSVSEQLEGLQQTAPDTANMNDASEARRGKRGRKSLRIRRRTKGGAGGPGTGVNVPGGTPVSNAGTRAKRGGPNLPRY